MHVTEIVHATSPEQRCFQLGAVARRRSRAAHQSGHPGSQGRIQPLDICGIDAANLDLCLVHQHFGPLLATVHQPARDTDEPPAEAPLDHLNDVQILPNHQWWPSALASQLSLAKHVQDRRDICREAINREQDWASWLCSRANVLNDWLDQCRITVPTDRTPEPQSRKDTHRGGNPDRSSLCFGVQLIGLNLAKLDLAGTNKLFMDLLGMRSGFGVPIGNRPFIEAKCKHDRWDWATTTEQCKDNTHEPEWMLEAEQRCAVGLSKGFLARMTDEASFAM